MQVTISGRHIDVTASLRTYIGDKLSRLERHCDQITDVHVVLGVVKLDHEAEATIRLGGATYFAQARANDMYAAIDALTAKLDRQLKKHKEKANHNHQGDGDIRHD